MSAILSAPVATDQNTASTNAMTSDGYSWAQARVCLVDNFGKLIALDQWNTGGTNYNKIIVSSDGATWTEPTLSGWFSANGEAFLIRGDMAYDTVNDLLHVLWVATSGSGGVIYRRYSLTRDGSNNITTITRVAGINLQLDSTGDGAGMSWQHPRAIWISEGGANGSLLMLWGAWNNGVGNEVRASLRVLSNTVADNTAGNWVFPVVNSTTTITQAPNVAYSAIQTSVHNADVYYSADRKSAAAATNAKDIYVAHANNGLSSTWTFLRMKWKAATNDWTNGLSAPVSGSPIKISGTDTGYSLKQQLSSKFSEDTANDRMYWASAFWNGNTFGDSWMQQYLDGADVLSTLTSVAAAGGSHSYAPAGDIYFDPTAALAVASYNKSSDQKAYVQTFNGTAQVQAETALYAAANIDIPLLPPFRVGSKLFSLFRDTVGGSGSYHGHTVAMSWLAGGPPAGSLGLLGVGR